MGKDAAVAGNVIVVDVTDASSLTTGRLMAAGGLGVAKAAFVGTSLEGPTRL